MVSVSQLVKTGLHQIDVTKVRINELTKGQIHYAILVADRSEAGRRPVADLLASASSLLAS